MCTCICDDSSPYTSQAIERCPVIGLYPSVAYGPGNQTYMWILSTLPQSSSVYIVARNYIYKYVYIYIIIYIHMYPRLCICLTKCTFYVNSASTSFDYIISFSGQSTYIDDQVIHISISNLIDTGLIINI